MLQFSQQCVNDGCVARLEVAQSIPHALVACAALQRSPEQAGTPDSGLRHATKITLILNQFVSADIEAGSHRLQYQVDEAVYRDAWCLLCQVQPQLAQPRVTVKLRARDMHDHRPRQIASRDAANALHE